MALSKQEIDRIAERWDKDQWDEHEKAFARQWMRQAQEDVSQLVEALREAAEGIEALSRQITATIETIEGDPGSQIAWPSDMSLHEHNKAKN